MEGSKRHDQGAKSERLGFPIGAPRPPQIRRATLADCEAIVRAHRASVTTLCAGHYTSEQIEAWIARRQLQEYHSAVQNALVLVAEQDGDVIGFCQIDLISGVIHALYVDPHHIGQGVGRSLLLAMQDEARAVGLRRLHVSATLNSVAFYQSRGFLPLRPASNTLSDGTAFPCVEMEKSL